VHPAKRGGPRPALVSGQIYLPYANVIQLCAADMNATVNPSWPFVVDDFVAGLGL